MKDEKGYVLILNLSAQVLTASINAMMREPDDLDRRRLCFGNIERTAQDLRQLAHGIMTKELPTVPKEETPERTPNPEGEGGERPMGTLEYILKIATGENRGWSDWTLVAALCRTALKQPGPWRCFHCSEVFETPDAASLHFGKSERDQPMCQISVEHVRWLEAQHQRACEDDTDVLRTIRGILGEHEKLRKRAEEDGYARGLADAKKHPEELGLMVKPS